MRRVVVPGPNPPQICIIYFYFKYLIIQGPNVQVSEQSLNFLMQKLFQVMSAGYVESSFDFGKT